MVFSPLTRRAGKRHPQGKIRNPMTVPASDFWPFAMLNFARQRRKAEEPGFE